MAFRNFLRLFITVAACAFADGALTEEPEKDSQIPELPAKEEHVLEPIEKDNLSLISYDEKNVSGFFTDNIYTKGPSRFLNALELSGYMRFRLNYMRNLHLQTFVPELNKGTSLFRPDLSLYNAKDATDDESKNPAQNQFSNTMRLRVNPTINVSETVRIKSTLDIFDNLVLGSTPSAWGHGPSFLSGSQNGQSAISVKRAWAEASFAIGDVRFGRVPFHWGLGILHNSGDDINNDFGDQVDGIFFSTRLGDHFLTPGYSIAYTGPLGRAPWIFSTTQGQQNYLPNEPGVRVPIDTSSMTHVLSLSLLKRDSDFLTAKKTEEGRAIFNYGAFAAYRHQTLDIENHQPNDDLLALSTKIVKKEGNVGELSLWSELSYDTFHLEMEGAGVFGKYAGSDNKNTWLLRGGLALESRYGFLNDRLQIGLDGGFASGQQGEGFGLRDASKNKSNYQTNFQFNPAYNVDLLLHKEVLGGVSGTAYFKPHIAYFFSRNFGLRADVVTAIAPIKSNTPGDSHWLGTEIDANAFLRSESGFYFQLAYGLLLPFDGLNHKVGLTDAQKNRFGTARTAQTIQGFFGVSF